MGFFFEYHGKRCFFQIDRKRWRFLLFRRNTIFYMETRLRIVWNIYRPEEIEKRSFDIIRSEMEEMSADPLVRAVVYRVIHATADFEFACSLFFSDNAAGLGAQALRSGAKIVTDTNMARAGISQSMLGRLGGEALCLMADDEVVREAKERGVTRAVVSMEHAVQKYPDAVYAIGNAPTALLRLCELMEQGAARPALVIGAPVGFVNVVESKEMLLAASSPYIVARGRKGGSAVAAAIVNALLYGDDAPGMRGEK